MCILHLVFLFFGTLIHECDELHMYPSVTCCKEEKTSKPHYYTTITREEATANCDQMSEDTVINLCRYILMSLQFRVYLQAILYCAT